MLKDIKLNKCNICGYNTDKPLIDKSIGNVKLSICQKCEDDCYIQGSNIAPIDEIFCDERCVFGLTKLNKIASGLEKLRDCDCNKMTDEEMTLMYNELYLGFNNYYGKAVGLIGHLTLYGKRRVFAHNRRLILQKSEHFIKEFFNY